MMWVYLWLIGAVAFLIGFGVTNRHYKIIHRSDFKNDDDVSGFIVCLILATIFWPVVVIILAIVGIGWLFRKYFIPE